MHTFLPEVARPLRVAWTLHLALSSLTPSSARARTEQPLSYSRARSGRLSKGWTR